MNLKQLFDDERAVSPVIGVILMVAITVILAAVIGTFVLGLGDRVSTAQPSASFQFDYTNQDTAGNDSLQVTHASGDTIQASTLNASVSGARDGTDNVDVAYVANLFGSNGNVAAGDSDTINRDDFGSQLDANDSLQLDSATVRVVWSAESGDSSATLAKWTGPDA